MCNLLRIRAEIAGIIPTMEVELQLLDPRIALCFHTKRNCAEYVEKLFPLGSHINKTGRSLIGNMIFLYLNKLNSRDQHLASQPDQSYRCEAVMESVMWFY